MLDSTFFKFLIAFIIIIALSFLVMGVTGGLNPRNPIIDPTTNTAAR